MSHLLILTLTVIQPEVTLQNALNMHMYVYVCDQWVKNNMSRHFVFIFSNFWFWRPFWIQM